MAKSWLQSKRFKMKVYRERKRGVLKKYSSEVVNVGRTINKEGMAALYKDSRKGLGVSLAMLNQLNQEPTKSEPRQAARELREKVRNGTEPLRYFRLLDDAFARARLYYSLNPEYCYILELNRRTSVHRRSIRYLSREIALARYYDDTIDWDVDFYHIRIPETFPVS